MGQMGCSISWMTLMSRYLHFQPKRWGPGDQPLQSLVSLSMLLVTHLESIIKLGISWQAEVRPSLWLVRRRADWLPNVLFLVVAAMIISQRICRKPEVPASPRGEALFRCARPSGVPRGPATSTGSLASQRHDDGFQHEKKMQDLLLKNY